MAQGTAAAEALKKKEVNILVEALDVKEGAQKAEIENLIADRIQQELAIADYVEALEARAASVGSEYPEIKAQAKLEITKQNERIKDLRKTQEASLMATLKPGQRDKYNDDVKASLAEARKAPIK